MSTSEPAGETIERTTTPDGDEIALVKRGDQFEIIYGGTFLMATDCRRSEQALAELGLAPLGRDDITVLVAGLGMGHTLRAVLDQPGVVRVDVVEISQAVVDWNHKYFKPYNGAALDDPRVHVHVSDLMSFLKRASYQAVDPLVEKGWLALLLDIDNGPRWVTRPQNAPIYTEDGLRRLDGALRHGGVLAVWSSERDLDFYKLMHARFTNAGEMAVPVEVGGRPSLDYIYRGRRRAEPRTPVAQA